ncbi:hypothetical protein [Arcticibacter sp. MXS-1]|uniref:hypothetical protein n=1 Tax=Arcticibacter sp. MXS-1 TaxID=3341726 RepID=UPI0035A8A010
MKKFTFVILTVSAWMAVQAQPKGKTVQKGFWVVESNIRTQKLQVVTFYDDSSRAVYSETISGKKLPYHRQGMQKKLNDVLAAVMSRTDSSNQKNLLANELQK